MFENLVNKIIVEVKKNFAKELTDQGHKLTGSLINSLEGKDSKLFSGILIDFYMNDYGNILDAGTKASKIPFNPGSGKKQSDYIDGLIRYAKKRMGVSDDKEAQGIAFAIAYTQKQQGMPTKNSFKYSKNGKRTGFIDATLKSSTSNIEELIEQTVFNFIINYNYGNNSTTTI